MTQKQMSNRLEDEKLKIELELKFQYYGAFASNVLSTDQRQLLEKKKVKKTEGTACRVS